MKQKKFTTKKQKSKFEEDCYDASSLEEDYDIADKDEEEGEEGDEDKDDDKDDDEDLPTNVLVELPIQEEKGPKKRGPKPVKNQFYVEPKEFDEVIMQYYSDNIISDSLATMISKIAHKLSYAPNFINYTYRDEMVGDAIVRMMKALIARKYTHNKGSNPFSYFTKIAFNAFRNRIKKEKYTHEILQRYQEDVIMSSEYMNFVKNKKTSSYSEDSLFIEE